MVMAMLADAAYRDPANNKLRVMHKYSNSSANTVMGTQYNIILMSTVLYCTVPLFRHSDETPIICLGQVSRIRQLTD